MVDPAPAPTAQGTFGKTPFPHLLVYALERRLSGTFELHLGSDGVATILVLQGFPAKLRTTEGVHFLGDVMLGLGLVTPDALKAAQERMQETPRLQGQILLELGAVDEAQLDAGVRAQLERKLEYLFTLPAETVFSYYDGVDALQGFGLAPTPVDSLPILWRGVRQQPAWEHVDATLGRVGGAAVRLAPHAQLERFQLTRVELSAVELLRQRPLRVVDLAAAKLVGPSVAQLLVYLLMITKQVDLVDAPAAGSRPDISPASRPDLSPASGQAFARVQLKPLARSPLVVEEAHVPRTPGDDRISSPLPRAIALPTNVQSTTASADAAVGVELDAQKRKILDRAARISSENYFQMLGLDREAPPEAVQKAFFALAKVWHPDRLPAALDDVRDACSKVFTHLTDAQATLCDAERRTEYMTLLKDGGATPDDQAKIHAILEAATDFQKAEIMLNRNDAAQAYDLAKKAYSLDPERSEYLAMVTWLESQRPEWMPRDKTLEKIAILDQCIVVNARSERAYFWRGMLFKRVGDTARAMQDFKRASELNPRNLEAMREVRLHNMRGQSKPSKPSKPPPAAAGGSVRPSKPPPAEGLGGLFGKLFKK